MKKPILTLLLTGFCISLIAQTGAHSHNAHENYNKSDSLVILWTSKDPEVFKKVVFVYGLNSSKQGWWDNVELIIWGPSTNLLVESTELQEKVIQMKKNGVTLTSCKWCAEQYSATEQLEELGVEVKYMGKPLTNYLKAGREVLVF